MLQEKRNLIEVVGLLSEVSLEERSKDGKDYLTGKIVIKTKENLYGVENDIEVPFQVFANKLTKAGNENPAYKSLMDVKENMTSIAACGDPKMATTVRVYTETGGLRENTWYDKLSGKVATTVKPNASFFNAVNKDKYDPTARFETVICVMGMDDVVDKDGVATGDLKVTGAVPGWNGSINKIEYVVKNNTAVEHIKSFWNKGDTVIVSGIINYTTEVETIKEEMGFGEPLVKHRTRSKRELVITRGSAQCLDEDQAFNTKEILEAMQERKQNIDKLQEEGKAANAKPEVNMKDYGF